MPPCKASSLSSQSKCQLLVGQGPCVISFDYSFIIAFLAWPALKSGQLTCNSSKGGYWFKPFYVRISFSSPPHRASQSSSLYAQFRASIGFTMRAALNTPCGTAIPPLLSSGPALIVSHFIVCFCEAPSPCPDYKPFQGLTFTWSGSF